jgi:hypothetical protein
MIFVDRGTKKENKYLKEKIQQLQCCINTLKEQIKILENNE